VRFCRKDLLEVVICSIVNFLRVLSRLHLRGKELDSLDDHFFYAIQGIGINLWILLVLRILEVFKRNAELLFA